MTSSRTIWWVAPLLVWGLLQIFRGTDTISTAHAPIQCHQDQSSDAPKYRVSVKEPLGSPYIYGDRKLVAFTALGTESAIATVHFNVMNHFLDWDCIVFVHAPETYISSNGTLMREISQHCSLVRLPGTMWTHFLLTLTPELTRGYDYIAIVLDDVFGPTLGNTPISVPLLMKRMQDYNLSTISPAIKGAYWSSTKPRNGKCLHLARVVETFFQIYRIDLFQCWRSFMEYSNPQGTCLDMCLERSLCPSIANNTMGVDSSMVAYHLGRQWMVHRFVPKDVLANANLSFGMRRDLVNASFSLKLCHQLGCPTNESDLWDAPKITCWK